MGSTPYAANRALALLSKAFELAEVWGLRPEHTNPCRKVERYPEKSRERFLSHKEFADLGEVLTKAEIGLLTVPSKPQPVRINPQAIPAVRLLIFTGARVDEILSLRWEWINWDAQRAELPDSETGKKHVHLPAPALDVLRSLQRPASGNGYVIRGGSGADPEVGLVNIKDPWRHLRAAAGLDDARLPCATASPRLPSPVVCRYRCSGRCSDIGT